MSIKTWTECNPGNAIDFLASDGRETFFFPIREEWAVPRQYHQCVPVSFFCEECADTWGHVAPVEKRHQTSWRVEIRNCRTHGNGTLASYSICADLPRGILIHDFLIISEQYLNAGKVPSNLISTLMTILQGRSEREL